MACALINSNGSEVDRFKIGFKRGTDRMCWLIVDEERRAFKDHV